MPQFIVRSLNFGKIKHVFKCLSLTYMNCFQMSLYFAKMCFYKMLSNNLYLVPNSDIFSLMIISPSAAKVVPLKDTSVRAQI